MEEHKEGSKKWSLIVLSSQEQLYLYEVNQLQQYSETLERLLKGAVQDLQIEIEKQAQLLSKEDKAELDEWYFEQHTELSETYPSILRESLFVSSYSLVESLAFKICAHAKELNAIRLNVKDLRGNGLEQCYAYLTKVVGLKQLQDNPHYAQLAFLTHIRNALVHNQGTLREADKLESQLKQWDSVSLNQFGGVRLSKNFNEKMLSHVRDLGLDIFAALRESFGR